MDGTRDAGHRTAYLEVRLAVTQDADFDCNAPRMPSYPNPNASSILSLSLELTLLKLSRGRS